MSGHSKWATTHRAKSAVDAKRGAVFTKLGRAISSAARSGGGNPESNFKLRLAIDQARAANMPKDNIERAIAKATGQGGDVRLEAVTYEGFGPHGVAVIVDCLTDNRNRTGHEIRHLFEGRGGHIGTPGSVGWQFERTGIVTTAAVSPDDELALIDLGASDIRRDDQGVTVLCPPAQLEAVRKFFNSRGVAAEAKIGLLPKETKRLASEKEVADLQTLLDQFDDHPDVQECHHNAESP